jgi:hypothetical protein
MTNPNNPEQDDQELNQEQLKDAAGGIVMSMPGRRPKVNEGPGHMKVSLGGSGGEDRLSPDA